MRNLPTVAAVLVLSSLLHAAAEKTIAERCDTSPNDPFMNQPIPEELNIADAPKTAREISCFASFKKKSTMLDVVRKCGVPDKRAGSGIYIFVYFMSDCSTVTVSTPDLKRPAIFFVLPQATLFSESRSNFYGTVI